VCSVYLAISVQYRLWGELENKYGTGNFSAHPGLSIGGGTSYFYPPKMVCYLLILKSAI